MPSLACAAALFARGLVPTVTTMDPTTSNCATRWNPLSPAGEGRVRALLASSTFQKTARDRQNVFAALMEAVKTHSLGQISHALYDMGGEYRRNV